MTAPVAGSGSWPAWMARVEKPGPGVSGFMRDLRVTGRVESASLSRCLLAIRGSGSWANRPMLAVFDAGEPSVYAAHLRGSEVRLQQSIQAALLDLRARLPTGQRRDGNAEQVGESLLVQAAANPAGANLFRRQQSGFAAEGFADAPVGRIDQDDLAAVATLGGFQGRDAHRVRP